MLNFRLIYSDGYYLPIGAHVFPAEKYRGVRERLLATGLATPADFVEPEPATDEDILRVHTPEYVRKLKQGGLSPAEELAMEIPYSAELVRAFWLAAGGSILAAECALGTGVAINVGGGFHHAFPDHGEGFCMIHDVAVAIRRLEHDAKISRTMVVDCDVHQGNGTAAIFPNPLRAGHPLPSRSSARLPASAPPPLSPSASPHREPGEVFTISLHQQNNYPAAKPPSAIDVNLPDGTGDEDYLGWLDQALSSGLRQFDPQLICYLAGADPFGEDQLGGLSLTIEGLRRRDELVFQLARRRKIPIMVTYAGGYARRLEDTVTIHSNTVAAAAAIFHASSPA